MRLPRAAWLAAIPLVLFWRAVFRGEVFYQRDIHLIWFGQVETFVRAVTSGSWPVWDPFTGFGQPLLANPDAQVLYPLTWLNFLMRPGTYYTVFAVSHLVFTGLGLHLLARRLGCSQGGAMVGAALWMASGPLLSTLSLWHHFASAAWAPWVFLAALRVAASLKLRDACLCGAALAAQLLAGSADMVILFGFPLALCVLLCGERHGNGAIPWPRLMALGTAAGATALALSAALWLPTLDLVRRSARMDLPKDVRTSWSVHPLSLTQALLPVPVNDLPLHPHWREALFDSREPFLASLYLGAAALPLVLAALVGRSALRLRAFGALTLVAAVLFALGKHAAFYGFAAWLLPPLRILRYPSKAMLVAAFAWALLAALGYDEWKRGAAGRTRWRLAVAAPVFLVGVVAGATALLIRFAGPGVGTRLLDPQIPAFALAEVLAPSFHKALLSAAVCALAAGLAWRNTAASSALWTARAAAALALMDLVGAHVRLNPTAPEKVLAYRPPTLQWIEPQGASRLYVYDYYGIRGKSDRYLAPAPLKDTLRKLKEAWPYPFPEVIEHRTYLWPPVGALFRLFGSYDVDMRGLQPSPVARLSVFLRAVEGTPVHLLMLRMGAVSRVIARHTVGFEDLEPLAELDSLTGPVRIYGVPDPLPRAYVVSGARIADGQRAFDSLLQGSFDPAREVILPEGRSAGASPSFSGSARIVELRADRVRVEAQLSGSGYLVLADAYDPGWRVSVDGQRAPLLRANIAFRGVEVAAGRHLVEFVYRPRSLLVGLAVSAAAALVAAAAASWSLAKSGREGSRAAIGSR